MLRSASAVNLTLFGALEDHEKEAILWLIGQLVGNPPPQRYRLLDRLVAAIAGCAWI
jgi:hypothetical protein